MTHSPRAWERASSQFALIASGRGARTYRTRGEPAASTTPRAVGGDDVGADAHHRPVRSELGEHVGFRVTRVEDRQDLLTRPDHGADGRDGRRIDGAALDQLDVRLERMGLDRPAVVRTDLDVH